VLNLCRSIGINEAVTNLCTSAALSRDDVVLPRVALGLAVIHRLCLDLRQPPDDRDDEHHPREGHHVDQKGGYDGVPRGRAFNVMIFIVMIISGRRSWTRCVEQRTVERWAC